MEMDLSLLKELYEKGLCVFADSFDSWQEAVAYACEPLIKEGYIEPEYVEGIYKNVERNGFYIFLAPHICMPHCGEYKYVHRDGLCFMKCNTPVPGDPDEPEMSAELFFVLAAENEGKHIDSIERLAMMLEDENIIDALLAVRDESGLIGLLYDHEKS